jgi:hypothetical protein
MGWNGVGGELWQVEVTGGEGKGRVGGQRTGQQCVGMNAGQQRRRRKNVCKHRLDRVNTDTHSITVKSHVTDSPKGV